jgi:hypothetical protein
MDVESCSIDNVLLMRIQYRSVPRASDEAQPYLEEIQLGVAEGSPSAILTACVYCAYVPQEVNAHVEGIPYHRLSHWCFEMD